MVQIRRPIPIQRTRNAGPGLALQKQPLQAPSNAGRHVRVPRKPAGVALQADQRAEMVHEDGRQRNVDDDVEGEQRDGDFEREADAALAVLGRHLGEREDEGDDGDGAETGDYDDHAEEPDPVAGAAEVGRAEGVGPLDEEHVPGGGERGGSEGRYDGIGKGCFVRAPPLLVLGFGAVRGLHHDFTPNIEDETDDDGGVTYIDV